MSKLYDLETSLFKARYLRDVDYLNNIFHNDYIEYGKSGMIYRKKDTIESLLGGDDRDIKIIDFTYDKLGEDAYIVHYVSIDKRKVKVLRTSIWLRNELDDYQLYFHQGTIMNK